MARILVVDDDPLVRETLRMALEHGGHTVLIARNGVEAVDIGRLHTIDLFLVDIIMPEKEGIQTIIELRQNSPRARIIAMSGGGRTANFDYLTIAHRLGAASTLRKPFNHKELLDAVRACLE